MDSDAINKTGKEYYEYRQSLIAKYGIGLTKVYNKFHDASEVSSDIWNLRELHRQLDISVATSYGWHDISLDHAFHETKQWVRFTISESARIDVLRRLSELNRQRYKEEVARGLHADAAPRTSTRASRAGRATSSATAQPSLDFENEAATTVYGAAPAKAILGFLNARNGWHAKADVLAATGITDGQWNAAIADLIAGGRVERQGERRGARYRATNGVEGPP